jgi:regulator of protease activity HflC (stomatin/prohibitin superfamily)
MTVDQRTAGRFALASGVVTILAAVVLVVFFLVEAPALVESGNVDPVTVFGSTNDALIAAALALLIPVAIFVGRVGEATRLHQATRLVGLAGLGLGTVFST